MYLLNFSVVQHWIINKIDWAVLINNNYTVLGAKYFLYWAITIVLSIIFYKYFELPIMNLRDSKTIKRLMIDQNKQELH